MEEKLAIFGGDPIFKAELPITNNINNEEKEAVRRVMESGVLSDFVASWGEHFLGGREVKNLEQNFGRRFNVKHAVSFNSATTALHGAVAAAGIGLGDEVITSPYTMTATPSSVLMSQGVPVFVDIDENTFCLNPDNVERKITSQTKAIIAVNIFGHPCDFDRLQEISRKHGLILIEDNAQGPGAIYKSKYAGTIGDIGIYSYNFHKTIHCGEGGILVTNNDKFAFRAQLLRNHGEVVLDDLEDNDPRKEEIILGSNYRLSELHAAIANEQLKKLDFLTEKRIALANYLTERLREIPGLIPAYVQEGCKHVYYVYAFKFNSKIWGIKRDDFVRALKAEGVPVSAGYVKPLYLIPMYQRLKVYNQTNYPFYNNYNQSQVDYSKGSCPVVERMYEKELLTTNICRYPLTTGHIDLFIKAIKKIYQNRYLLK